MANPTVRRSNNPRQSEANRGVKSLPLNLRRGVAWALEITLVVASGVLPLGIGVYLNSRGTERVPLSPVLAATENALERTLDLPVSYNNRNVDPLTNLFCSAALLAPLALGGWQLYLLAKTGSTTPKRWLGVRVIADSGQPPGLVRVVVREGIGRWGLPLTIAYYLWRSIAFPHVFIFTGLAGLLVLGEGLVYALDDKQRALHDRLAGTMVIDGYRYGESGEQWSAQSDAHPLALAPASSTSTKNLWQWMRLNPSFTLLLVTISSTAAILATLVSTQIYAQNQANNRKTEQVNGQQFVALLKQLDPGSTASLDQRRAAILAMGTLDDPQALQFLVQRLSQETNPSLLDAIQQSLTSAGTTSMPYLQQLNQSLSHDLESVRFNGTPQERELRTQKLFLSQKAIAKILAVYSGKTHNLDLNRTNLGQTITGRSSPFTLVLDKVDLSGIQFKGANLNHASLRAARLRGPGEDGRWDTYDDWITNFSYAQMQESNLSDANLSRVLMTRTDLSRSTLNRANLSNARLSGANLNSSQLVGANLSNAILENASLTGADLGEANLKEADLVAANLRRVVALGTQLSSANLTNSDWQGADLSGADLTYANLTGANLSATRMTSANLRSAKLRNTNLRNADLSLVDLRGAKLAGADLQGAIFVSFKQNQGEQFVQAPAAGSESTLVKGVDFGEVKGLDAKQLAYICTQGGIHPRCP